MDQASLTLIKKYKKHSNLELKNLWYNDPFNKEINTVIEHRIMAQSSLWFKIKKVIFIISLLTLFFSLFYSKELTELYKYLDNLFIFSSIFFIFYTIDDYFNSLSPLINTNQNNP